MWASFQISLRTVQTRQFLFHARAVLILCSMTRSARSLCKRNCANLLPLTLPTSSLSDCVCLVPCSYPHKHKCLFKHHFSGVFPFVSESTEKAECPCSHGDIPLHFQPVVWLLKRKKKTHPRVISTVCVVNRFKIKCHWCCWKVLVLLLLWKKSDLVKTISEKGYWFFVHCLQQKRSWGCSFHKGCCEFYYHLDCGGCVLILREKPFNVRKWLCLLTHSKRSSCASGLAGGMGTSSPAS